MPAALHVESPRHAFRDYWCTAVTSILPCTLYPVAPRPTCIVVELQLLLLLVSRIEPRVSHFGVPFYAIYDWVPRVSRDSSVPPLPRPGERSPATADTRVDQTLHCDHDGMREAN
eukprot:scaffold28764_cov59-Phaeocystis_antarctica.AAC.2